MKLALKGRKKKEETDFFYRPSGLRLKMMYPRVVSPGCHLLPLWGIKRNDHIQFPKEIQLMDWERNCI
ncbi:MAG: hypothetical protein C4527_10810 [Candidatus Omnitrophota bacterium]|nr:MAG: hypothetical protein C4527_10810 [Candidatus Omnitrophota bacterium]